MTPPPSAISAMEAPANQGCKSGSLISTPICLPSPPVGSTAISEEKKKKKKIPPLSARLSDRYYAEGIRSSRLGQIYKRQEAISGETKKKGTPTRLVTQSGLFSSRFDGSPWKTDVSTNIPPPMPASSSSLTYSLHGSLTSLVLPRRPPGNSPGPRSRGPQEQGGPGLTLPNPAETHKSNAKTEEAASKTSARPEPSHCIAPTLHFLRPVGPPLQKSQTLGSLEPGSQSASLSALAKWSNKRYNQCHDKQIEFGTCEDSTLSDRMSYIGPKSQTRNEQGKIQRPDQTVGQKEPEANIHRAVLIPVPIYKSHEDIRMASDVFTIC
jgi:hypothetical protein